MERFFEANRAHWAEVTPIHVQSAFYDVPAFKAGRSSLQRIEVEELGDVKGKTLLHLMCHFGLDTLSWARAGAVVTGVDFSTGALAVARGLAEELGIPARFIETNVYELPYVLDEQFDVVFTSYGVLVWLPDLDAWAKVIARSLRPGGTFYMVEGHPTPGLLAQDSEGNLYLAAEFLPSKEPVLFDEPDADYADPSTTLTTSTYEWSHTLGDVVSALSNAGLRVLWLHEHEGMAWRQFPSMTRDDRGWWMLSPPFDRLPLTFSLMATR